MWKALVRYPFAVGLSVRLILAVILPWMLDSGRLIPGVAYTDIDFHVYSDAARHIQQGGNPFDRATYRYTPFLAALLAGLPTRESARYLFCLADAVCGWLILSLRRRQRKNDANTDDSARFQDALWWLYNPLAINICTRGSAESGLVLLPVLLVIWVATTMQSQQLHPYFRATLAGVCHGVAIHAKLYPIIYTLSFVTNFVDGQLMEVTRFPAVSSGKPPSWSTIVLVWARRLLSPAPIMFGLVSMGVFVGLTYASVVFYGDIALQEGLLYHFSRVDHRHNYSLHWYWIYLARAAAASSSIPMSSLVGRLLLVPQLVLLIYASIGVAPHNLPLALFLQTFLFVAHNKVITAQYFTWYLCLLPLCSDQFVLQSRVRRALGILLGSIGLWLGTAYCLEMQGMSVHRLVWVASSIFFVANVNLLGALLASSTVPTKEQDNHITTNKVD